MAASFIVGDYEYSRFKTSHYDDYNWNVTWSKDETKFVTFTMPNGYELVEGVSFVDLSFVGNNVMEQGTEFVYGETGPFDSRSFRIEIAEQNPSEIKLALTYKGSKSSSIGSAYLNVDVYSTEEVDVYVVDKTKSSYQDIPYSVSDGSGTYSVVSADYCFEYCRSLIQAPVIPNTITNLEGCFSNCTSLTQVPDIPSSATNMDLCFEHCSSLTQAPVIPGSVTTMYRCFSDCELLEGNVEVHNVPTIPVPTEAGGIFQGAKKDIYIVNPDGSSSVMSRWKNIAQSYTNVHYEADDNPAPVISNFSAKRVSAVGSTDFDATGLYAYIQVRAMVYDVIPVGWNNSLETAVLTDNGSVESPTWQPLPITQYPADEYCWIYLGDTSVHTITLQITDAVRKDGLTTIIKTQTSQLLSVVVSKSYALVDYYHDETTDTEGIAFGKYAEHADLFDVDMPAMFRQNMSVMDANNVMRALFDFMHPKGSCYHTLDANFDPNISWGGTWEPLPEGMILLSGSADGTYIVGEDLNTDSKHKEYGGNEKTIVANNLPAHTHPMSHTHTMGHTHNTVSNGQYVPNTASGFVGDEGANASGSGTKFIKASNASDGVNSHKTTGGSSAANTGGSSASNTGNNNTTGDKFNVMQKSMAVYTWIRTA